MPVRIGLIGCGNIACQMHAPTYKAMPEVQVCAVADVTPARLSLMKELLNLSDADCYSETEQLLMRDDIDCVVIMTPQQFRREIVIAAAQAGKQILCEKPIAVAPQDADAMIAAARQAGVRFGMVHNYIFFPEVLLIKELIETGAIGDVVVVVQNYLSVEDRPAAAEYKPDWRHNPGFSGGGVLMDMIHPVYLAEWFFGSPIRSVSAAIDRRADTASAVEDLALVRLEFDDGYGLINMAWGEGPGGIEITGTRGRILVFYKNFGTCPFMPVDQIYVVTRDRVMTPHLDRPVDYTTFFRQTFQPLVRDFIESIKEGREPIASAEAGKRALEAVLGCYESAALERVVYLPLPSDDPVYRSGVAGLSDLAIDGNNRLKRRRLYGL